MIVTFLIRYSGQLAFVWALIILALCSIPGQYIPSVSFLELLSFDKWVHAGIFFVLFSLIAVYIQSHKISPLWLWIFFSLCVLYGIMLEYMQATVFSNRSADWQDMVANSVGALAAFILNRKLYRLLSNRTL
jgi:VanZ family protein